MAHPAHPQADSHSAQADSKIARANSKSSGRYNGSIFDRWNEAQELIIARFYEKHLISREIHYIHYKKNDYYRWLLITGIMPSLILLAMAYRNQLSDV